MVGPDRTRFSQLARALSAHRVLAHCDTCEQAIEVIDQQNIDLAIIDVALPDGHCADLIRYARHRNHDIETLVLISAAQESDVTLAIAAGATACAFKRSPPASIAQETERLLSGGSSLNAGMTRMLVQRLVEGERQGNLTKKEAEVLSLLAKGMSYEEAASLLDISVNTLRSHVRKIYEKIDAHSRSEAVFEAARRGWFISADTARFLLTHLLVRREEQTGTRLLSPREREVLSLLAEGLSYTATAQALDASINTIRAHIRSISRKLNVHSIQEAIFEVSDMGFARHQTNKRRPEPPAGA